MMPYRDDGRPNREPPSDDDDDATDRPMTIQWQIPIATYKRQ
jgi:hypothetical protein